MIALGDAFDGILVINLARRADRMEALRRQADALGFDPVRIDAVDAADPTVARAYERYAAQPLATLPEGVRPIASEREFYLDYEDERARVPYIEAKSGRKAIASAGAFAHLGSMIRALEHARDQNWQSVLILEDDVLFHNRTSQLFAQIWPKLPSWHILQLGTMQLNWSEDWVTWHSRELYRCHGTSIASHAFAVRAEVIPLLLEQAQRYELPFDTGALHAAKHAYDATSFTVFPNLAIQDAADSDIRTSTVFFDQMARGRNVYRWEIADYGEPRSMKPATRPAAVDELARRVLRRLPGIASRRGERRAPAPEPAPASGPVTVQQAGEPAPPPEPQPPTYDEPALRRQDEGRPPRRVFMAVVLGLRGAELESVLDILHQQGESLDVEPVLITDEPVFEIFRRRRLIFEYLPSLESRRAAMPRRDWELFHLRRLRLWRLKWQPGRIVAFGAGSVALLEMWRNSPFEDEGINYLIASPSAGQSGPAVEDAPAG